MDKEIGYKIKALRKKKKLTLKDISERTQLSISFLSQLERMKSSLTLDSLKKISEALGVNPSYFFSENDLVASSIVSGRVEDIELTENQFLYQDLSGKYPGLPFSPLLVVLNPGENKGNLISHTGVEFLYVLEGTLTVKLDKQTYNLYPHDSVVIDSKIPHYWFNYTNKATKFLCISAN